MAARNSGWASSTGVAGAPGYETGGQERLRAPVMVVICGRFGLATQGRCVVDDRQRRRERL
jgi:hypothetical protein